MRIGELFTEMLYAIKAHYWCWLSGSARNSIPEGAVLSYPLLEIQLRLYKWTVEGTHFIAKNHMQLEE